MASLLRLPCGLAVHEVIGAAARMQKKPRGKRGVANNERSTEEDSQSIDNIEELELVAGACNHLYRRPPVPNVVLLIKQLEPDGFALFRVAA